MTIAPERALRTPASPGLGAAILCLLGPTLLAMPAPAGAQTTEPAKTAASREVQDSANDDPSQETDISEDNYRRFMELDDRRLDRPAFAPGGVKPANTLQKLGALPETSQKHLRNQLRGIILSRGAWTPGERDEPYAFVPSAEARENAQRGDAQLLQQEAEAWTELVNEYHEREAAVFAGPAGQPGKPGEPGAPGGPGQPGEAQPGQRSAEGARQAAGTEAQTGQPASRPASDGEGGQEGRDGAQGQAGSDSGTDPRGGTSSESPPPPERPEIPDWAAEDDPTRAPAAPGNEGVEQSASDYLRARGLANGEPTELEAIGTGRPEEAMDPAETEQARRWGVDAQGLLPEPGDANGPPGGRIPSRSVTNRPDNPAPDNALTREELLRVRGVTKEPPEEPLEDDAPRPDAR